MKNKRKILLVVLVPVLLFFSFYIVWNTAAPQNTCASCHEIGISVSSSSHSAHRKLSCSDCHGTALSNGLHSLKEKVSMVYTHLFNKKRNDEIHLSEEQILDITEKCKNCHQTEYADWMSGGHSITYRQVFLDKKHNSTETPYWDCFRCHGAFYKGNIYDLMEPVNNKGPWRFKDYSMSDRYAIPCLTCHEIHSVNDVRKRQSDLSNPKSLFYNRPARNVYFGLYIRADKIYLSADKLGHPQIYKNGKEVLTSNEVSQNLCIQCHSPNFRHEAGTSDDRTPTGVHEGISCRSCHLPHSNNVGNSCDNCHPAISNCGLDVKTMNTSFASKTSPFNIHSVDCKDCHPGIKHIKMRKIKAQ